MFKSNITGFITQNRFYLSIKFVTFTIENVPLNFKVLTLTIQY